MYKINVKIKGCKNIDDLGDFIRTNNIKVVLFGEYHGFLGQDKLQRKIIQVTRPDFFLYEMLEESKIMNNKQARIFLNKPNNQDFSFICTYGYLKPMIRLARAFSLQIIGCDIKNMCIKNKNWSKISHKERIATFSDKEAEIITRKRELRQVKIINKYSSKGLVFVILGTYHLRRNSVVLSHLKDKKAIIIRPSFDWRERFNDRKKFKDSDVSYNLRMVS